MKKSAGGSTAGGGKLGETSGTRNDGLNPPYKFSQNESDGTSYLDVMHFSSSECEHIPNPTPYQTVEERDLKQREEFLSAIDSNNADRVRDLLFDFNNPNQMVEIRERIITPKVTGRLLEAVLPQYFPRHNDSDRSQVTDRVPDPKNAIICNTANPADMYPVSKFELLMHYNEEGQPLLHRAVAAGATHVVELFLEGLSKEETQALLQQQNSAGRTSFDLAVEQGGNPTLLTQSVCIMRMLLQAEDIAQWRTEDSKRWLAEDAVGTLRPEDASASADEIRREDAREKALTKRLVTVCLGSSKKELKNAIKAWDVNSLRNITQDLPVAIKMMLLEENPIINSSQKTLLQAVAETKNSAFIEEFITQFPPQGTLPLLMTEDKYIVNEILLPAVNSGNSVPFDNFFHRYSPPQRKCILIENPELLAAAVNKDTTEMVSLLLRDIPSSTKADLLKCNPMLLDIAARKPDAATMRLLLDGIDTKQTTLLLAQREDNQPTILHIAALGGHQATAEYLLTKGADPTARINGSYTRKGQTPAGVAKEKGYAQLGEILTTAKVEKNAQSSWGEKILGQKKDGKNSSSERT